MQQHQGSQGTLQEHVQEQNTLQIIKYVISKFCLVILILFLTLFMHYFYLYRCSLR